MQLYSPTSERIERESFVRLLRHAGGKLNEQKAQALFFALDTANVGHISFGILLFICSNVFTVLNCISFSLLNRLVCAVHGKAVGLQVSLSQIGAYTTAKEQRCEGGKGGRDKQLNERITMHFGGCINELIGWF